MTTSKFLLIILVTLMVFQGLAVLAYFIWGEKLFVSMSVAAFCFLLMVWKQKKS